MRILACESVSRSGSVCWSDGARDELHDLQGESAEVALVAVLHDQMTVHGKPDALAVAIGPGSFTGLRVAVTAIRTLAWIEQLPVHAVDSLVALACEQGPGLWWPLVSLKRDTTFHALVAVDADGKPEVIMPSVAQADAEIPTLPGGREPVAIGPALVTKPQLVQTWRAGTKTGSTNGPTARGVAQAARFTKAKAWAEILPAYLQEPAPVLQRRKA
jgi:tRNA threonylcarbamoyl adenosine modification protein YeaZ